MPDAPPKPGYCAACGVRLQSGQAVLCVGCFEANRCPRCVQPSGGLRKGYAPVWNHDLRRWVMRDCERCKNTRLRAGTGGPT